MKKTEADTKTLILDAAEQAFAEVGFAAASLRFIISRAGVNLAAVHYHFGSKEELIQAVFARRINPINRERFELLDAIEKKAGKGAIPLEPVIEALVGPVLRLGQNPERGGPVVVRLLGRTIAEPSEQFQRIMSAQFGEVVKRFTAALRRALPKLPEAALLWRLQFSIGSMAHVMCDPARVKHLSRGLCDPSDTKVTLKHLVAFVAAGLRAPVPK